MAAEWQAESKLKFDAMPAVEQEEFLRRHNMKSYKPRLTLPSEILECRDGICVFSNPETGLELMRGFNNVLSGLRKKGQDLAEPEVESLLGWMESSSISPAFIRRFVQEHGAQSIFEACCMGKDPEAYALDYLLRRYKGKFYRMQYPAITLVE
jgi:hypothetical protein